MKIRLSCVLFAALAMQGANAQSQEKKHLPERRPAQVSLIPGVGTNGSALEDFYQPFSFNLIGGYNGGLHGFEVGGIFNREKYFMRGMQVAGAANLVAGEVHGVQVAGVLNTSHESTNAWQVAGIANISKNGSGSQQLAGVVNLATGDVQGIQLAGIANRMNGNMTGIQAAGIVNITRDNLHGVQIAGIVNRASSVRGLQIGLVNSATHTKGLQIGLFNKVDSAEATLGLINIVRKNGYYRGEVWASETFYANAAFKMGTRKLYSVLAAGWRQKDQIYHLGYGLGIGTELFARHTTALNLDLLQYHLAENELWTGKGMNNLYQTRLTWAKEMRSSQAFFLGLTFNLLHTTSGAGSSNDAVGMELAPAYAYEKLSSNRRVALWPGLNLGIRF